MNVYFISGLGADRSVFSKIQLENEYEIIHLDWIINLPGESIENYARRLSEKINTSEPFVLLGLSFGGIVALEIAKFMSPKKVILLSSVINFSDFPWYLKLLAKTKIYYLAPIRFLKSGNFISYYFFSLKTKEQKKIFSSAIENTDKGLFKWSIYTIMKWKGGNKINNVFRIHGSADRIFPIKKHENVSLIQGAGHLMVFCQAAEVSKEINKVLKTEN